MGLCWYWCTANRKPGRRHSPRMTGRKWSQRWIAWTMSTCATRPMRMPPSQISEPMPRSMSRRPWGATWFAMSFNSTATAKRPTRIFIVRLGAMGDVIHTLPAVADLRKGFPDAYIGWAIERRWSALLEGNPHIDRVITVGLHDWRRATLRAESWRQAAAFARDLRNSDFDLAIDFQGLLKSAAIARLCRARLCAGFERSFLREPLAGLAYNQRVVPSQPHVVDRYRELTAFATGLPAAGAATFTLPPGETSRLPERFVLASPQAGWGTKQWPPDHYSALAARIRAEHGIPLLVDCAPSDQALAEDICRNAPAGAVVRHPSTISQLIAATRRAEAVIGVDSGPLHLAAALDKPGVAIFGPTDPERNGPYGSSIKVIRLDDTHTTYKRGSDPSAAMRACSPDLVYEGLRQFLP